MLVAMMSRGISALVRSCRTVAWVAVLLGLASCGGGGGDTLAPEDKSIASVQAVGGKDQTATAGSELPLPLELKIANAAGTPLEGQIVSFVVVSGGGSVFVGFAQSDRNGLARERWTLGTRSGVNRLEVRGINSEGAGVVFATFEATATAGAPRSLDISTGDGQYAAQLQTLPSVAAAVVRDAYGNPVRDVEVSFTAQAGGAASPSVARTDSNGVASTQWTLGPILGSQSMVATVPGLDPMSFTGTATRAAPGAPATLAIVSGNFQSVAQHTMPIQPFLVRVTDALGNPVPNAQVAFRADIADGIDSVPALVMTDGSGIATWSCASYLHWSGTRHIDVSAIGSNAVSFDIIVQPNAFAYDGQYSCEITNYPQATFKLGIKESLINSTSLKVWDGYAYPGSVNAQTGTISMILYWGVMKSYDLKGQLSVDLTQMATGAGTFGEGVPSSPPGSTSGVWSCTRQ